MKTKSNKSSQDFYLLSITKNQVKFFKADHQGLEQIVLPQIPHNLDEVVGSKSIEKQLQMHHGATTSAAIFHGHQGDTDFDKNELEQYLRKINHVVSEYLSGKREPLLLAAVERTFAEYKRLNTYPYLIEDFVHGSHDRVNDQEIHQKAIEVLSGKA